MAKINQDKFSKDEQEYAKQQLILLIHKNIMACKKCDEGYVEENDTMTVCGCCINEFIALKEFSHIETSVSDHNYDEYVRKRKTNLLFYPVDKKCIECNSAFTTNVKGRVRCKTCYALYTKESVELAKEFKKLKEI